MGEVSVFNTSVPRGGEERRGENRGDGIGREL